MAEEVKVREEKKNASKSATKDMTVGSPMRLILGFSIPLLCGAPVPAVLQRGGHGDCGADSGR